MSTYRLEPSTEEDLPTIASWCKLDIDPSHHNIQPEFFLTGCGFLTFKIVDENGTVLFVRVEGDADTAVLHLQFAPESVVAKIRLVRAMLKVFPLVMDELNKNFLAVKFESTSTPLIRFFSKLGFQRADGDFYRLDFPVQNFKPSDLPGLPGRRCKRWGLQQFCPGFLPIY